MPRNHLLKSGYKPSSVAIAMVALLVLIFPLAVSIRHLGRQDLSVDKSRPAAANAGPVTIPDTNYPIPGGSLFVAPTGSDANVGTQAAPFATLGKAVATATSGQTIVLRAGVYREGSSDARLASVTKNITIQAYPHEQAWLDGTQLTATSAWTVDTSTTWELASSPSQTLCQASCVQFPSTQIDTANYPMAGSPQMVFIDGNQLTEAKQKSDVAPTSFYFDGVNLFIGINPAGHSVEVTVQKKALDFGTSSATGAIVRGIGIRRYGSIENPSNVGGFNFAMIQVGNGVNGVLFENDVFQESASRGLFINADSGATVRSSIFLNNGMNGFDANGSTSLTFASNEVFGSNAEHFSKASGQNAAMAGSKLTAMTGAIIRDNTFAGNDATGWWCDLNCTGTLVMRNLVYNNGLHGIDYEISGTGTIVSNLVYGNAGNGIQAEGQGNRIYNNTSAKNLQDLAIWEDSRLGGNNDTRSTQVGNNIFADGTGGTINGVGQVPKLVDVHGSTTVGDAVTPDLMVTAMDHDAYYRTNATIPQYVLGWQPPFVTSSNFSVFGSNLQTTTGREAGGQGSDGGTNPYFVDEASNDYHLKGGSSAIGAGAALLSDIVTDLGISAGPVDLGALAWPGSATGSKPGDINGDGHVDIMDLGILAANFRRNGMIRSQGDLNGDGVVNIVDFSILAHYWGT